MPTIIPPPEVIAAFIAGETRHTRRVEIYEADGVTRWQPEIPLSVVDGSIAIGYGDSERRTLDGLVLNNADGSLRTQPGGLWYDKIIKVFRGVKITKKPRAPRVAIVGSVGVLEQTLAPLREALTSIGYGDLRPYDETVSVSVLQDYDVVITLPGSTVNLATLTAALWAAKIPVFSLGRHPSAPYISAGLFPAGVAEPSGITFGQTTFVTPKSIPHPVAQGWGGFSSDMEYPGLIMTQFPASLSMGWTRLSDNAPFATRIEYLMAREVQDARWVAWTVDPAVANVYRLPGMRSLMMSALSWLSRYAPIKEWEMQVGEFMIDRISQGRFPPNVTINGRDYVKKCSSSKYLFATEFAPGQKLEAIIATIAGSAGVTKRILPVTPVTVNKSFYFDRGVTRWEAMREIVKAYDYELFFDSQGYLVMQQVRDPALTPPIFRFSTGSEGVLVDIQKSTSDTRIYNVVVVTGESSDAAVLPVFAVARNESPTSPTSVAAIGERVYQYTSSFITTTEQAQTVADSFLAVHALEEFEANFESLLLPWLEVGEIIGFDDPDPYDDAPESLLLTSLTIPIKGVGGMTSTGKRVMKV